MVEDTHLAILGSTPVVQRTHHVTQDTPLVIQNTPPVIQDKFPVTQDTPSVMQWCNYFAMNRLGHIIYFCLKAFQVQVL